MMKTFKQHISETKKQPSFSVKMYLHHKHAPIIYIIKNSTLKENNEEDPIGSAAYKSLGHFKPSSLDHDTITKEFHEHLHKHGLYSSAPSHPMVLSPKQAAFKDEFKKRVSNSSWGKGGHKVMHRDYGHGRLMNYPHPHIGVWATQHPTHLHKNSGEEIHNAIKPGHAAIFHDSKVKHRAPESNDRWFLHSTDIKKIPKTGLPGHGNNIHSYIASKKPAQSKLRRDVMDFHRKQFGTPKHKEVMDWLSKEHPDLHPDKLKHNVSGIF